MRIICAPAVLPLDVSPLHGVKSSLQDLYNECLPGPPCNFLCLIFRPLFLALVPLLTVATDSLRFDLLCDSALSFLGALLVSFVRGLS